MFKGDMNKKRAKALQKVKDAIVQARQLEERGLYRRAATAYTAILGMASNASEMSSVKPAASPGSAKCTGSKWGGVTWRTFAISNP